MLRKLSWLHAGLGAAIASGVVLSLAPAPVRAESLYRWESADGTVSFTDDAKRIPERYRAKATTIDPSALSGYGRYTPTDAAATADYARRLEARLDKLRAASNGDEAAMRALAEREPAAAEAGATQFPAPTTYRSQPFTRSDGTTGYRYYQNAPSYTQSLPVDPNDPNPVITEERHIRVPGEPITQRVTVTRQGDRVLSVTRQRPHYHTLDFGEMSDYENLPGRER